MILGVILYTIYLCVRTRFDLFLLSCCPLLTRCHYYSRQIAEITAAEKLAVILRYLNSNRQLSSILVLQISNCKVNIANAVCRSYQVVKDVFQLMMNILHSP